MGVIFQPVGQAESSSINEKPRAAVDLILDAFANGFARLHHVFGIGDGHPFDINGRFQSGQQFTHAEGVALVLNRSSQGRRGGFLSNEGRWRHLRAGHAVNGVVHKNDGDVFTAIGRLQNIVSANGSQISIALVAQHDGMRKRPFYSGGGGRSPTVRHLYVAAIEIVVSEHRAAHRTDEYGALANAEVIDGLGDELVNDAVPAAGTVVRGTRLGGGFAGEAFKEGIGFLSAKPIRFGGQDSFYHGSLFHFNGTRICADERRWILSPPLKSLSRHFGRDLGDVITEKF